MIQASNHTLPLLDKKVRKVIIRECLKVLTPIADTFQAIAISGYSMAMIAPCIADKLKKNLILVRKKSDDRASNLLVEGETSTKTYIIIDDLVCGGDTLDHVVKSITDELYCNAKCVGAYFFKPDSCSFRSHDHFKKRFDFPMLNTTRQIIDAQGAKKKQQLFRKGQTWPR